ncbi:filament integrity protein FraC [Calothrix sp. PCC 6303]|uniref:filament integrity protein FraC n=1 Tax=Calothrix sp. PCC 6303 TaxID=1170562 RepID=UPI0002A01148|nr:filament integrity protein FraC [Calothrix sp. PCC 6303]AFZ04420.1 filament integrity protein [Calothrix sp. PCC 6303]
MLDFSDLSFIDLAPVFPLGAILFNFLFFLITIPIEAYIFNNQLKFDKKTSVFYAICINLFSGVIGWIIFFIAEPFLPIDLKSDLITYVFFNQYNGKVLSTLLIGAFIVFFSTFLIKFGLFKLSLISLREPGQSKPAEPELKSRWSSRRLRKFKLQDTSLVQTILIANSLSYSAIVLVMLISTNKNY